MVIISKQHDSEKKFANRVKLMMARFFMHVRMMTTINLGSKEVRVKDGRRDHRLRLYTYDAIIRP